MERPLAVICGAGVAGLAAAYCLHRVGWRSVVVEKADNLRQGGYFVGLSGVGYMAARDMGILPQLEAVARDIDENVYFDRRGREIMRLRYRDFLAHVPFLVLHRTDLIATLEGLVKPVVDLRLATTVADVDDTGGAVRVSLSSGETLTADLMIGADGFRSTLRRRHFGDDDAFLRPLGYRFAAYDLPDSLGLGFDFLSYSTPGQLAEYYTLAQGRLAAVQVWRSHVTGAVPENERWDLLTDVAKLNHPDVLQMIETARVDAVPIVDDMSLVDMPAWSKGRVLLLGDAAHCLTLVSGQGAGLALASAVILASKLAQHDVHGAVAKHDAQLRPAVNRLQERSRRMASWFIPASRLGYVARNTVLKNIPTSWLGRYFNKTLMSEIEAVGTLPDIGRE
ncbi:MAG: FAD-dependent monooxygenase [Pseudomonadota bacterium]